MQTNQIGESNLRPKLFKQFLNNALKSLYSESRNIWGDIYEDSAGLGKCERIFPHSYLLSILAFLDVLGVQEVLAVSGFKTK